MHRQEEERLRAAIGALPWQGAMPIPSDVLGSYTGRAEDGSKPVQDADDL